MKILTNKKYNEFINSSNVYKASVGELFTGNGINFNTVSNLNSKFGSSVNKR